MDDFCKLCGGRQAIINYRGAREARGWLGGTNWWAILLGLCNVDPIKYKKPLLFAAVSWTEPQNEETEAPGYRQNRNFARMGAAHRAGDRVTWAEEKRKKITARGADHSRSARWCGEGGVQGIVGRVCGRGPAGREIDKAGQKAHPRACRHDASTKQ